MIDLGIILLGILIIVFKKSFSKHKLPSLNVKLPEKNEKLVNSINEVAYLITGIIFIIIGLLSYFHIIKMR